MKKWILGGTALAMIATCAVAQRGGRLPAECREEAAQPCDTSRAGLRERLGKGERGDRGSRAATGANEMAYGSDPLQKLDFWRATDRNAPLVIFVHGGGWKRGDKKMVMRSNKAAHYKAQGYAFASINYRLVPDATVEQQASDVANAVAYLRKNAQKLGIDPKRIVLMGHSAGAHLSALVGTDPQYLRSAGLDVTALSGVIPLDGAAYDVPSQMGENARIMGDTYEQAFGTDPARQKALSPIHHAGLPNSPAFLILHVQRADGVRQSAALADALRKNGAEVKLQGFEGKGLRGHGEINRRLGDVDYPATPVVDAWLSGVFGA